MERDSDLDVLPLWQERLLQRHQLPPSYLSSAQYWFDPLVDALAAHQNGAAGPVLVAINGSQGSGKSTLCTYLELAMAAKHQLRAVTLSLDDFYYTHKQRQTLAEEVHPLLVTRGVPGTHDLDLLNRTLDDLILHKPGHLVEIPRFDKALDDRIAKPERLQGEVDLVLLEGWCLGAPPQSVSELVDPVNALEAREDPDGIWRNHVNSILARDFAPLYQRVDQWVMLQAPSFECVYGWRLEQEQKLAKARGSQKDKRLMDEKQIARFIQHYQRLTEVCLEKLPDQVQHLFTLDETRGISNYRYAKDAVL